MSVSTALRTLHPTPAPTDVRPAELPAELQIRKRGRTLRGKTHGIDPRGPCNLIRAVLRAAVERISRVIVQAQVARQATQGVLLPEGGLGIAQGTVLTPALQQELSDGSVWLDGVEPSMLTGRGPFMPAAVALSADGTTLVHEAFEGGRGFMSATDIIGQGEVAGERMNSNGLLDPPSPRSDFKGCSGYLSHPQA